MSSRALSLLFVPSRHYHASRTATPSSRTWWPPSRHLRGHHHPSCGPFVPRTSVVHPGPPPPCSCRATRATVVPHVASGRCHAPAAAVAPPSRPIALPSLSRAPTPTPTPTLAPAPHITILSARAVSWSCTTLACPRVAATRPTDASAPRSRTRDVATRSTDALVSLSPSRAPQPPPSVAPAPLCCTPVALSLPPPPPCAPAAVSRTPAHTAPHAHMHSHLLHCRAMLHTLNARHALFTPRPAPPHHPHIAAPPQHGHFAPVHACLHPCTPIFRSRTTVLRAPAPPPYHALPQQGRFTPARCGHAP
ncbi:hypothetical protein DENSPDRAFT_886573 [Dentipellis sp. KUC8613]|nr:hypothetical protein DENSPDRAFT_886573 [Dentipellis sp. KUC8613]